MTPLYYVCHIDDTYSVADPQPVNGAGLLMVAAEQERQDDKWGGPGHDDIHTTAEFVQLIEDYAGWARTMSGMRSPEKAERRLIQVAALAIAAAESSMRLRGVEPT